MSRPRVPTADGVRLFDCPGIEPVRWERLHEDDPTQPAEIAEVDLRYRPAP